MSDDVARFELNGKVYTTGSLDEVNLRDVMLFNTQAADMGLRATWSDVEAAARDIAALNAAGDDDGAAAHPDIMLLTGVTIWAARRIAGDDVTFEQSVDFPLSSLTWLPPTGDRKPGKAKARKGGKPKGSAAAGARSADRPPDEPTTPPTSVPPSDTA